LGFSALPHVSAGVLRLPAADAALRQQARNLRALGDKELHGCE
jgi:hypothetical protein